MKNMKIKNQGSQLVKAPAQSKDSAKGTVKHTGGDLRCGTKAKK